MKSALMTERIDPQGRPGSSCSGILLGILLIGLAYHAILILSSLLYPYRFPIPYAVPIFDTPFVLVALAVGYICLERHRLLQDFRSAAMGIPLWLCALLAFVHILAQPDYPGTPGVNPGVAPYFFLLSYLMGFTSIALATHYGHRELPLSDRNRLWIGLGVFGVSLLVGLTILQLQPVLPPMAMQPGRFTPYALWLFGVSTGLFGAWALWGGIKQFWGKEGDWFAGFLLLAGLIWLVGLVGFLLFPFRYAVSWYVAGLARPIGVMAIFVGLLREQVWLYREARARQRDLEGLNTAGQALATNLDGQQVAEIIATTALAVSGAVGSILYRLDAQAQALRPVSYAGWVTQEFASSHELPIGMGVAGLAVAELQPVWTANLHVDPRFALSSEIKRRASQEDVKAILAIPILRKSGGVFGALAVSYEEEREFAKTDVDLLSAFGFQASEALENARSFEQLALKALHDASLQAFSQRLLETSKEETILHEAVALTQDLLHTDYVGLYLLDPGAGSLSLQAGSGWEPGSSMVRVPLSTESWVGYAFLHKESVAVEDLAQERRFTVPSFLAAHGVEAGLAVPLGVHNNPIGIMAVYYRRPRRLSEEESRVFLSLTQVSALALDKVRLYTELQANLQRLQETQTQLMQANKLKALGTLLSGMAHEMNNPLSTILLSVQLVKKLHVLSDPVRQQLDAIEEESKRASRIIRRSLMFARRRPPERQWGDLNQAVEAALSLQTPELDRNNIRVLRDLEPSLPPVWADLHQFQQVFLNLFVNATHAIKSAKGQGSLTVRTSRQGAEVCVEVSDDGPGIPPEHLSQIFDPFFTTKGAGEGTGLGLSLSLGIVESHGGRMYAKNLPGSGARFTVRLPIEAGVEPFETPSSETLMATR